MPAPSLQRVVVVTDLHLGEGPPLTTFREADALVAFLRAVTERARVAATELVLAGDTFDFLATAGYDGFDVHKALDRFARIVGGADTTRVIEALAGFMEVEAASTTILAGNHDPELFVPAVRRRLEEALGGCVRWADDEGPLARGGNGRLPLHGRSVGPAAAPIWILHGDVVDGVNALDRDAIKAAIRDDRPVTLPKGSHLVFEVLNTLKPKHPWLDEVKPELPTVILLLLYCDWATTTRYLEKHQGLVMSLVAERVRAAASRTTTLGAPTEAPGDLATDLARTLVAPLEGHPAGQRAEEAEDLARYVQTGARPRTATGDVLGPVGDAKRMLLRAWLWSVRESGPFTRIDGPDSTIDRMKGQLPDHLALLVAGHTHGPRAIGSRYANAGTWLPVAAIPEGRIEDAIADIERGERWAAKAPMSYVDIEIAGTSTTAHLRHWSEEGGMAGGTRVL